MTAFDKDGVCVLLHFASDCPPGRPDVLAIVVSMLNTAPLPVKNLALQVTAQIRGVGLTVPSNFSLKAAE